MNKGIKFYKIVTLLCLIVLVFTCKGVNVRADEATENINAESGMLVADNESISHETGEEAAPADAPISHETGEEAAPADALEITPVSLPILITETGDIASGEAFTSFSEENKSNEAPEVLSAEAEFSENNPPEIKHLVNTEMIRRPVFQEPTVLAQWQMSAPTPNAIIGRDDSTAAGAQLLPSGGYQISRSYSICALAADGFGDIESIAATVSYPEDIAFSAEEKNRGCGRLKSLLDLEKHASDEALAMVCENIRLYNNNLIVWNKDRLSGYTYDYEQVCGSEGLINSGKAVLFCGQDNLFYDDPAGDYQVVISAKNNKAETESIYGNLKIMELTMFEADFKDFQYGLVEEMNWKTVFGDTIWEDSSAPTIRNIGNTRLNVIVNQNDFGFGKTGNEWNISYRARIGGNPEFSEYFPDINKNIANPLNLSETSKIDFSVLVKRFPEQEIAAFSGKMILSAEKVEALTCK